MNETQLKMLLVSLPIVCTTANICTFNVHMSFAHCKCGILYGDRRTRNLTYDMKKGVFVVVLIHGISYIILQITYIHGIAASKAHEYMRCFWCEFWVFLIHTTTFSLPFWSMSFVRLVYMLLAAAEFEKNDMCVCVCMFYII